MNKLLIAYQAFLDLLEKASMAVAMILTGLLFVNTATGIIVDQVVGNSLIWIEEVNNLLFAWAIFIGAGIIARRGGHIGVEMIYDLLGPYLQWVLRIVYAALALIIVWVMVYYGVKMALFVGRYQTSLYLDINLFYYYLSVPVGGALLGLFSIGAALPDPRTPANVMQEDMQTVGVDL
ncbi:TRAP transporter small permease [Antarcticimicrobium luteum]|uniref:TRAP transporter small permease protein n=1 Tax=Antarcticimicrobium luteum TaxID=2547397 RepID=A0A4R5VEF1_9RHOB|nr:TRAP transporter small permease [Antarcticimicrobium luteum]TDK50680.1 TRAP transporter small permease [Antarcticimicrobium luteum]